MFTMNAVTDVSFCYTTYHLIVVPSWNQKFERAFKTKDCCCLQEVTVAPRCSCSSVNVAVGFLAALLSVRQVYSLSHFMGWPVHVTVCYCGASFPPLIHDGLHLYFSRYIVEVLLYSCSDQTLSPMSSCTWLAVLVFSTWMKWWKWKRWLLLLKISHIPQYKRMCTLVQTDRCKFYSFPL